MKQIVLCDLTAPSEYGLQTMTTWLDKHPKLQEGALISLSDYNPTIIWTVQRIYESPRPHFVSDFDFHRKWDNNNYDKHEGLKIKNG